MLFSFVGYVTYLCDKYPAIIDDAIDSSPAYLQHIIEKLKTTNAQSISISEHESASILMGKCNMSQRAYKNLKKILKAQNVFIPRYEKVTSYIQDLDVGMLHRETNHSNCMCVRSDLKDTIQHIMDSELGNKVKFFPPK